jgi:uncharacterized RDD family membrane protein YckC
MTAAHAPLRTPSLLRRLACFVYEGVVLFGVVMIAGYLYSSLTQQRHALQGQWGLRSFLLVVLAIYFVWFWSHGGQTVAMKTWHIRLIAADGGPVTQGRALARYLMSWVWFMPALASVWLWGIHGGWAIAVVVLAGVIVYAMSSLLAPQRQYWHDTICGTWLIDSRPGENAKPP